MIIKKSSFLYNPYLPAPSFIVAFTFFVYALFSSGCAGLNPLTDYDFTEATLAVEAPIAPPPAIVTNSDYDIAGVLEGSIESIFTATTAVVKESKAGKARRRIKRASEQTDVALLVAEGILERSERYLNFAPVEKGSAPDLILFLNIDRHGIYSGPAFDGRTEFFLDAYIELVDDLTGERLWEKELHVQEPISDYLLFSNIRSSNDLSNMSEEEMSEALERISDYTADTIVRVLRREIARAKR